MLTSWSHSSPLLAFSYPSSLAELPCAAETATQLQSLLQRRTVKLKGGIVVQVEYELGVSLDRVAL